MGKRGIHPQPAWLKRLKGSRVRRKPTAVPVVMPAELPGLHERWQHWMNTWILLKRALDAKGTAARKRALFKQLISLEPILQKLETRLRAEPEEIDADSNPLGFVERIAAKPKLNLSLAR